MLNNLRRWMTLAFAVMALLNVQAARAQDDGVIGWVSNAAPSGVVFPSAYEACKAQWNHYMNNGYSRFIGANPNPDNWRGASCVWTQYQYLCPQENPGAGFDCGTIYPSGASVVCASGYTPTVDGHCRSNPPPEKPCNCPEDGKLNPTVGNPIVVSSGAKFLQATDYESADGEFRIGRQYRSFQVGRPIDAERLPRSLPRGLAGGWNLDVGYEIQLGVFSGSPSSPNAKVAVLLPDGTGVGFALQSSGNWTVDSGVGAGNERHDLKLEFVGTLPSNLADVRTSASNWKVTDRNDTVWSLQTRTGPNGGGYLNGWPTQKAARGGYTWTYAYNTDSSLASITDSFGRAATFSWYQFYVTSLATPPAGSLPYPQAIASISLPDGTSLKYTYDPPPATSAPTTSPIKRLVKVQRLSAANAVLDSTTYLYEDTRFPTHITGVIDNRAVRTATYAYDGLGRATATQGANGADAYTVEYGLNGTAQTRRVTNVLGKAENYTFSEYSGTNADYRLTQIAGEASAHTLASTSSVTYGSNTFIADQTNAESSATVTTRDSRGRATSTVEADGTSSERTTTTTWHSTFNLPTSIVREGQTETRTYTTAGELATLTLTDTTSQTVPYSTNGQTRTWTYDWNAAGRLLSVNGPRAAVGPNDDITTYTYDTPGNLQTVTDPLGHVTTFGSYDSNGRPGTMTDPNGIVTAYVYDGLGRVQTVTVQHPSNSALNATTTITYDAIGQVTGVTLPSTDTLIMDYDAAGRLTSMRAASGERWDYAYDAMGNVTRETVRRGDATISRRITRAFDELGRMIQEAAGYRHSASLAYDKVDNLTATTTPSGHTTTAAFDPLNRVVSTVAPDTGTTALGYDDRDNLLSHTDPISVTTTFVYNGFGEAIQEVSPDRGTSTYVYDAAGDLIEATDGRGQLVTYTRDLLGRVTSKVPQGKSGETVSYTWDSGGLSSSYAVGRLAKVVDASGTTQFRYDHRGNLLAKQQAIGATSAAQLLYEYDFADRITQITYPSGRLVKYTYDSKGRVSAVETKASSGVGSWTSLASSLSYEPFGAVKAMTLGNGLAVVNTWGVDGLLASRRLYRVSNNTDLSNLTYRREPDGNIAAITDLVTPANSVVYGYDSAGRLNLTIHDGTAPGAETYAYALGKNRLTSVTDGAGTRSITYDARGNTSTETRPGSVGVTTGYDGYGRLTGYNRSGGQTLEFAYNGLDDRVTTILGSDTRRFVYDADGRVLGEYGNSVSDAKAEFIWASPAVGGGSAFGGDDGLGGYMPLAVATPDLLGAVQLNWVHGNHLGVPLVTTDNAGNAASTPNDYFAPGFPGQSRVLADLYYNRHRDYDPTTGRYIQADPIGLAGGANIFNYVGGNPVNAVDPQGLVIWFAIPAAGELIGGAAAAASALWVLTHPIDPPRRPKPLPIPNSPAIPDCEPTDLCEQLAYAEARAGAGTYIMGKMDDEPRLVAHYGPGPWRKKQHTHRCPNGKRIVIHYFSNGAKNVELKPVYKGW